MPGRIRLTGKQSKYRARPERTEDGYFASQRELKRWRELKAMQAAGKVANLERQVKVKCVVDGQLVCTWVADHVYRDLTMPGNPVVYEDVKGYRTREYALKAKLVKACHGIEIREV